MRPLVRTAISIVLVSTAISTSACRLECSRYGRRNIREAALKHDLHDMRMAIDGFYRDKRRYPRTLDELVPNDLRAIPKDPITGKRDWLAISSEDGVVDVRSSAPGKTCDGVAYRDL